MTDVADRTKTALAVLGKPDKNFAYRLGPLEIPYLALSFKELDLIDAIPQQMPEDLEAEEQNEWIRQKRQLECDAAYHLLRKRLGERGPQSVDEVYDLLNPDLFYPWVNALLAGQKGEAKGAADQAPPNG